MVPRLNDLALPEAVEAFERARAQRVTCRMLRGWSGSVDGWARHVGGHESLKRLDSRYVLATEYPSDRCGRDGLLAIEGFNTAVANADGYRVVVLSNGEEASVPVSSPIVNGSPGSTVVQPDSTIYRDCGYSWMYMDSWSPLQYVPLTGFVVNTPAIDYSWNLVISGPYNYENHLGYGGALAFDTSWSNGAPEIPVDDAGYYNGEVVSSTSYAILDNGGVCFSGGPSDTVYVS